MSNLEEGLRWMEQAEAEFAVASDCLKDGHFFASAFFSQQSAEKALKGFLYTKGLRAILTHSVLKLLEEASQWEEGFKGLEDYGRELDRHYIGARYPNFYPSGPAYKYYNQEIAKRCLNFAQLILEKARKSIKR